MRGEILFEKVNRHARDVRNFRLRHVASDKNFRAQMLRRRDMDEIPCASREIQRTTRAQFIAPFQIIIQTMNT